MSVSTFTLRATLSDGFTVNLDGQYPTEAHALRASESYMRHYSDPCGLGLHVAHVAIIDSSLVRKAA